MSISERVQKFLHFWYIQYVTHTGLYMLDGWEICLFNAVLVALVAMASYTACVFLPGNLAMWRRFFENLWVHGSSSSSTVEAYQDQPAGT